MKAKLVMMSLALFVVAGCNRAIVGKWTLDQNSPDLKTAKTLIKSAEFVEDGTYRATLIEKGGKGGELRGNYSFNGFQLKLSTKEGDKVWNAMLIMNRTLELKRSGDKFKLKRVEQ